MHVVGAAAHTGRSSAQRPQAAMISDGRAESGNHTAATRPLPPSRAKQPQCSATSQQKTAVAPKSIPLCHLGIHLSMTLFVHHPAKFCCCDEHGALGAWRRAFACAQTPRIALMQPAAVVLLPMCQITAIARVPGCTHFDWRHCARSTAVQDVGRARSCRAPVHCE